jgi:hypothetical protein
MPLKNQNLSVIFIYDGELRLHLSEVVKMRGEQVLVDVAGEPSWFSLTTGELVAGSESGKLARILSLGILPSTDLKVLLQDFAAKNSGLKGITLTSVAREFDRLSGEVNARTEKRFPRFAA